MTEQEVVHLRQQDAELRAALEAAKAEAARLQGGLQDRAAELQDATAQLQARHRLADAAEQEAAQARGAVQQQLQEARDEAGRLRAALGAAEAGAREAKDLNAALQAERGRVGVLEGKVPMVHQWWTVSRICSCAGGGAGARGTASAAGTA